MSNEVLEAGIRFFSRLTKLDMTRFSEKKTIIFYGGEPFHNKPLLYHGVKVIQNSIVRGGLPDNTRLIIVTNGTLLNDDDILFIRDHNITLTFSLDGDKAASINRVYPDGQTLAWEKATANFRKCQEMGVDLNVACTLTPQTISRQQQVLDYFVHEAKASNIGFNVILDNDIFQLDSDYADRAAEFVSSSYPILKRAGITENRTHDVSPFSAINIPVCSTAMQQEAARLLLLRMAMSGYATNTSWIKNTLLQQSSMIILHRTPLLPIVNLHVARRFIWKNVRHVRL